MKKQSELQKIGLFIKELRERKNMTQEAFAKALETSQSAVARMEKGEQNFSTEILGKISEVLNHQIVSINESIDFKITGGRKLSGSINTNFSKNGAVGLLCASLLNKGKTTLHGIARIEEVYRVIEILESIGVSVKWIDNNSVVITPPAKFNLDKINVESAIITRSVIMLIGPLIHILPSFSIPHASGCKLGKRTISAHTYALEDLGAKIKTTNSEYKIETKKLDIDMDIEYTNSEDPIESMMFISAAIATDSELIINRCPIDFLSLELEKLKRMGLKYKIIKKYKSYNDRTNLIDLHVFPSKLKALEDKIHANPYPGINMDNLPFFVPIAIKAKGQTMIHDWLYENRAIYFTELNRLGASVTLADPHRVYIQGGTPLKAAQVVCPPALRPAMIILIGMLGATGTSILRNVYMINRGYEEIADRLNAIGADIKILK
ncbi:MAG: UDP-N-acetylglucosamine 1-carboxyvinyltransferase [Candidatus Nomurabacteria bacterium GW2011_GWC1_37_9]|nr:MAG: UDP-N-acetylglucosamine 1-carboxyvinyltransferase [Candidatus Nomurabacteria bacterium GW2011_GWC1_37_9]